MSAKLLSSSSLGTAPDTYLFTLAQLDTVHAVVGSDDTLRLFDLERFEAHLSIPKCNRGVTCVTTDARQQTFLTAGRDGLIRAWDPRSGKQMMQLQEIKNAGFAAIACQGHLIAAGTESTSEGLGDVRVSIYDTRKAGQPSRTYIESHTDTVTSLQWHPSQQNILLSGSTDGLVSIFDVEHTDEEDALQQVLNPRSAVRHVGLLANDRAYVLSTDEQFFVYGLDKTGSAEDEALPVAVLGDLRPRLDCMYIVDLLQHSDFAVLAHGHNEERTLALTSIDRDTLHIGQTIQLPGAHGEEVVRDVKISQPFNTVLSCGEDGHVRCWRLPESSTAAKTTSLDETDSLTSRKAHGKQKREARRQEKRFAPY